MPAWDVLLTASTPGGVAADTLSQQVREALDRDPRADAVSITGRADASSLSTSFTVDLDADALTALLYAVSIFRHAAGRADWSDAHVERVELVGERQSSRTLPEAS
jgi:hypothetical protein